MHLPAKARTRPTCSLASKGTDRPKTVQKHCCKLVAELSFAGTSETMRDMLGVELSPETIRTMVEGRGKQTARLQAQDTACEKAFQEAKSEWNSRPTRARSKKAGKT